MKIIKHSHTKKLSVLNDAELVQQYKNSEDKEIIGELYNRYHHIVFGVCLKYLKDTDDSNDALLEIFNRLFEMLKKYEIDEFKWWFLAVTRNYCLKFLKDKAKTVSLSDFSEKNISVDFMENEDELTHIRKKEKDLMNLELALSQLKPEQESCVRLFYLENKSYQEVVNITKFELKKVKSYIQNGKRNLQLKLEGLA